MNAESFSSRAAWERVRNGGGLIGGSSVAAIVGRHPHLTEWAVWLQATGQGEPREDSPRLRMGRRLEPVILDEWEETHAPLTLERRPHDLFRHPEHPWAVATLDGVVIDDGVPVGIVEAKSVCSLRERFGWGRPGELRPTRPADLDGDTEVMPIPAHYLLQCVWQMVVTGLDEVRLVGLFGSDMDGVREWVIPRPEWLCRMLLDAAVEWRARHVVRRVPPAVDGSDDCARFYRRAIPVGGVRERVEHPDPEMETARRAYERAAADEKQADARKALARNTLLARGVEPQNVRGEIRLIRRLEREVA